MHLGPASNVCPWRVRVGHESDTDMLVFDMDAQRL